MTEDLFNEFHMEATEIVQVIEKIALQDFTSNAPEYKTLFRVVHTLKGNAMFLEEDRHRSLADLIKLIHVFESYLEHMSHHQPSVDIDKRTLFLFGDSVNDFCESRIQKKPDSFDDQLCYLKSLMIPIDNELILIEFLWDIIDQNLRVGCTEKVLNKFYDLCTHESMNEELKDMMRALHEYTSQMAKNYPEQISEISHGFDCSLCYLRIYFTNPRKDTIYNPFIKRCREKIGVLQSA